MTDVWEKHACFLPMDRLRQSQDQAWILFTTQITTEPRNSHSPFPVLHCPVILGL